MHLKKDYITQMIGEKQMMVAVGTAVREFHGIVKSNETAAFIVDRLKQECTEEQIIAAIMEEYEVDAKTAKQGVRYVIDKLKSIGAVE